MKALVGAFNQEKTLVGVFSVIVQPVVEPMEHYTTLLMSLFVSPRVTPVLVRGAEMRGAREREVNKMLIMFAQE